MSGNARGLDIWIGICCCQPHDPCEQMVGPIVTWSTDVNVNHIGQARLGDVVLGVCGHPGLIVTASTDSTCNGRGMARLGDAVVGCMTGLIATSSSDVGTN